MNTKTAFAGSILASLFASLCCIGPIAFAGLGVTSVALSAKFEPLRPYFLTLTGIFLALGFYFVYRKPKEQEACESGICETPQLNRWAKPSLWAVTAIVLLLALFPNYYGKFRAAETSTPALASSPLAAAELERPFSARTYLRRYSLVACPRSSPTTRTTWPTPSRIEEIGQLVSTIVAEVMPLNFTGDETQCLYLQLPKRLTAS